MVRHAGRRMRARACSLHSTGWFTQYRTSYTKGELHQADKKRQRSHGRAASSNAALTESEAARDGDTHSFQTLLPLGEIQWTRTDYNMQN